MRRNRSLTSEARSPSRKGRAFLSPVSTDAGRPQYVQVEVEFGLIVIMLVA